MTILTSKIYFLTRLAKGNTALPHAAVLGRRRMGGVNFTEGEAVHHKLLLLETYKYGSHIIHSTV